MSRKHHQTMEKDPEQQDLAAEQSVGEDASPAPEAGETERLKAELEEWKDRSLRAAAEMQNYRRRLEQEKEDARRFANERLLSELLPVIDNFSRALEAAETTDNLEALRSGVEQIHRQLSDALARAGLEKIEAVGQKFDPNLHEAIMQVEPQDGQEPHQVVEELRSGYKLSDRVVRPTLVKVTSG